MGGVEPTASNMNEPTPHIVWVGVVMIAGIVAFMVRAWFRMRPLAEL